MTSELARPSRNLLDVLSKVLKDALDGAGFPRDHRGRMLFSIADFSGGHAAATYDTYAFLLFDLDRNNWWLEAQKIFRAEVLKGRRRMSFKNLNDRARQQALVPFLLQADEIDGALIVFAVRKDYGSMFETAPSSDENAVLEPWKPSVREHLMRVLHLGALSIARVSRPGQDLMWITDQDEIASNDAQLTAMTSVFGTVWANLTEHDLGHLRCGTTRSDDGSLALEDLCAIADLAAGASCELLSLIARRKVFPVPGIITPLPPRSFSSKTLVISRWLSDRRQSLKRTILVIDRDGAEGAGRVTNFRLDPISPFWASNSFR